MRRRVGSAMSANPFMALACLLIYMNVKAYESARSQNARRSPAAPSRYRRPHGAGIIES